MVQDGLINKTSILLGVEKEFVASLQNTKEQKDLDASHKKLKDHLLNIGNSKDIDTILAVELLILQNERKHFGNSATMNSSLDAGMQEVKQCQYMLGVVRNPERYEEINKGLALPKSRKGVFPLDDARKAFRGHCTRITNLDRGRLSPSEKQILTVRRKNFGEAEKLYIGLQQKALGIITEQHSKDSGLEL